MKTWLATLALCGLAGSASAATVSFDLPGSEAPSEQAVSYDCEGRAIGATYINAGDNALAILDLGEETVVTVNVISGSGARYAGQRYVWWTKGSTADLYDLTADENTPVATCREK